MRERSEDGAQEGANTGPEPLAGTLEEQRARAEKAAARARQNPWRKGTT